MELARSFTAQMPLVAGGIYGNLGAAYQCMGNYKMAIKILLPARDLAKSSRDLESLSRAYGNLGNAYQVSSICTHKHTHAHMLTYKLFYYYKATPAHLPKINVN